VFLKQYKFDKFLGKWNYRTIPISSWSLQNWKLFRSRS